MRYRPAAFPADAYARDASQAREELPADAAPGGAPGVAPIRLCAVLAAPITAINAMLEKHELLASVVDLGWLMLFAACDDAAIVLRYAGNLHWEAMSVQDAA